MGKMRVAFLGVGPRAQLLIDTYSHHAGIEFVAFCDIAKGVAEEVTARYNRVYDGCARAFPSYETLIRESSFELLIIGLDPDIQVDYAVDAMNRGIHVMTEVPAAYTIEQCHRLVDTVEKTGVKYQLAEQVRYWQFVKQWKNMAKRDEFGKIIYAEGHYQHYEPVWDSYIDVNTNHVIKSIDPSLLSDPNVKLSWRGRSFRNPILYLPHTLSPLLSITGGRISKVACFGTRPSGYVAEGMECRDMQHAIMYNSEDILFSVRCSFTMPHGGNCVAGNHWYQIKGTKASVELPRSTLDTGKHWTPETGWAQEVQELADPEAEDFIKNSEHGGTDWYPIETMVNAILNDTEPPVDVYKAVETAAPAILAAQSCEQGGVMLEVPDFRKGAH